MNQFQYEARDAANQIQTGHESASTSDELIRRLSAKGLRVTKLKPVTSAAAVVGLAAAADPLRAAPAPAVATPPAVKQQSQAQPDAPTRPHPKADEKDIALMLTQMGDLIKAGISPAEAAGQMSKRAWKAKLRDPLARVSQNTAKGMALSTAMDREPEVFSSSVAGAARCGEMAGCLPEALLTISHQQTETRKIRRSYWWMRLIGWFIVPLPIAIGFGRGYLMSGVRSVVDSSASPGDVVPAMQQGGKDMLTSPGGIVAMVLVLALTAFLIWVNTPLARRWRHTMALKVPFLKKWAEGESLSIFLWFASKMAKSGASPWMTWKLSAYAVPNEVYRDRLVAAGAQATENVEFSTLAAQAEILPLEYQSLTTTAEMTGTVPQALDNISRSSMADAQNSEKQFKMATRVANGLVTLLAWVLTMLLVYGGYVQAIIEGFESI
jgi:type II secretory pathway component PulF